MAGVPPHLSTRTGDVVWYCSGSLDAVEAHLHADTSDGLVLRGDHGLRLAQGLRKGGWTGRLWLDPATYERRSKESDLTLFGDRWTVAQDEIAVVERISPGTYVPSGDRPALRQAIEDELRWLSAAGDGRLSLALDSGWLSDDTDFVIAQLSALDVPIAIALADGNDPLSRAGAVSGYVEIVRSLTSLMLLRGDLGALGGVANGARLGAIGTSTIVRHAVPAGHRGGGVPGDKTPSVFLPSLLGFRLGSFLDQLPKTAVPLCHLGCCLGARLSRFNDERMTAAARTHNRLAVQEVLDAVLGLPADEQASAFTSMCLKAVVETEVLEAAARRRIKPSPQLVAWATLT